MRKQPITFKDLNGQNVTFNAKGFKERHEVKISLSPPNTLMTLEVAQAVNGAISDALSEATK